MKKIILFITIVMFFACNDKKAEPTPEQPTEIQQPPESSVQSLTNVQEIMTEIATTNDVDLQAVQIDPLKDTVTKGGQTTIVTYIKNNGPGVIPTGEAVVHITVNGKYFTKPAGFKSDKWKLDIITTASATGHYEIWVRNSKPMAVSEPMARSFQFTVKGKSIGRGDINLASTLSGLSTSGDVDGANQSVSTQIIVVK